MHDPNDLVGTLRFLMGRLPLSHGGLHCMVTSKWWHFKFGVNLGLCNYPKEKTNKKNGGGPTVWPLYILQDLFSTSCSGVFHNLGSRIVPGSGVSSSIHPWQTPSANYGTKYWWNKFISNETNILFLEVHNHLIYGYCNLGYKWLLLLLLSIQVSKRIYNVSSRHLWEAFLYAITYK